PCELRGLVPMVGASAEGDVDLLQAEDVGPQRLDLRGGARQIDPAVGTEPVADVAGRHPPRRHRVTAGSWGPAASSARRTARPTGRPTAACPAASAWTGPAPAGAAAPRWVRGCPPAHRAAA